MSVSEASARRALEDRYGSAVADHPDVMAECLSILRLFNLTPDDLHFKHEAFVMSRPSGLRAKLETFNLSTVRALRNELQREQQAKAVASAGGAAGGGSGGGAGVKATPQRGAAVSVKKRGGGLGDMLGLSTPTRPASKPASSLAGRTGPSPHGVSPAGSSGSPHMNMATPQRASPLPATASSYRPVSSNLAPPRNVFLETPRDKGANQGSTPSSPTSPIGSPSLMSSQPSQSNTLAETLNPHLPDLSSLPPRALSKPRVDLTSMVDISQWNYRYMFEEVRDRGHALGEAVEAYAEALQHAYGLAELGDPHLISQEQIHTVGRIHAGPTDSGKMSVNSLFFEPARSLGGMKTIALKLLGKESLKVRGGPPGVKRFGLYPGCIVGLKGKNGGAKEFVVEEVLLMPPGDLAQTTIPELIEYQHGDRLRGQPISLTVAAGPFTSDIDLLYAPLEALVETVINEQPDVFLLLGPFVDSKHPSIAKGAVTQTPTELFQEQISKRLQRVVDRSPGTIIILVPSVRDLVSRHMAFPQSMLEKEPLGLPKKVKVLPNPCTFQINEVIIAASSVDVLFHLRREEIEQEAQEADPSEDTVDEVKDSMAGLVRHVLNQQSFYPLFPPPEAYANEVCLDVTHYPLLKMEGPAPDVLILPSRLKHFVKTVDSTLVVNPAHLARSQAAGTYAKLLIHPTPKSKLQEMARDWDGDVEHEVYERARSEIWRV
ncbi:hypothetical protein IAT38_004785 [Cryptococcus sp. DSM 104549]